MTGYSALECNDPPTADYRYLTAAVLKPRQMVIVHGTPDSSRHLAEFCRDSKDMGVSQIFVPGIGETVDATSERHIYQVRLHSCPVELCSDFSSTLSGNIQSILTLNKF